MIIREINREDDKRLAQIIRRAFETHDLVIPGTAYFDPELDHLSEYYEHDTDNRKYFVMTEDDGTLVGGVGFSRIDGFEDCVEMQKLYLDDSVKGRGYGRQLVEYLEKAALDMGVAVIGGITFPIFFGSTFTIGITGTSVTFNPVVFAILATILYVVSINATNATDGVDGLSGTLTILAVLTMMVVHFINGGYVVSDFVPGATIIAALLAYLIFNHYPSKMLMGDAGSRAIGFFIAFYAMYLKIPFAYLIFYFILEAMMIAVGVGYLVKHSITDSNGAFLK